MKITIVSGSPRQESITYRIALYLKKYLETSNNSDIVVDFIDVREPALPILNTVFTSVEKAPVELKPLAETMFSTDAFILVTPEYNGGYSPALKNLFDHFPKQSKKTFGIVTGSTGALGGIRSTQQLFLLVAGLFGIASPNMLITPNMDKKFDVDGNLIDELFTNAIDNFMAEFLWLAKSVHTNK